MKKLIVLALLLPVIALAQSVPLSLNDIVDEPAVCEGYAGRLCISNDGIQEFAEKWIARNFCDDDASCPAADPGREYTLRVSVPRAGGMWHYNMTFKRSVAGDTWSMIWFNGSRG